MVAAIGVGLSFWMTCFRGWGYGWRNFGCSGRRPLGRQWRWWSQAARVRFFFALLGLFLSGVRFSPFVWFGSLGCLLVSYQLLGVLCFFFLLNVN